MSREYCGGLAIESFGRSQRPYRNTQSVESWSLETEIGHSACRRYFDLSDNAATFRVFATDGVEVNATDSDANWFDEVARLFSKGKKI